MKTKVNASFTEIQRKRTKNEMPVKGRERSKIVILDIQDIKEKIQLNPIKTRFLSAGE